MGLQRVGHDCITIFYFFFNRDIYVCIKYLFLKLGLYSITISSHFPHYYSLKFFFQDMLIKANYSL